jgi:hypothetical protein
MVEEKRTARWRLTEKAIREGVQPTTRHRNCPTPNKLKHRTPKRQAPGAKGGRSLSPHYTPDVNIRCSTTPVTVQKGRPRVPLRIQGIYTVTTPKAGALGSLLPAYSHTDFGADALFCTNQANLFN